MSSPWTRRLEGEYEGMCELRRNSSLVAFTCETTAPTKYEVVLSCRGLALREGQLAVADRHEFDVLLGKDFPLFAPLIVWKTPIFHPNFKTPHVCLGDYWYPAWSLAEMCVAICEMVQYKAFNVYDPLDRRAAEWVDVCLRERPEAFPVDRRPVLDLDFEIARPRRVEEP